jgi:hypothetical protein
MEVDPVSACAGGADAVAGAAVKLSRASGETAVRGALAAGFAGMGLGEEAGAFLMSDSRRMVP